MDETKKKVLRLLTLCFLYSILTVVIIKECECNLNTTTTTTATTFSWINELSNKLDSHVKKLESKLETYLDTHLLPYLRIIGSKIDHKSEFNVHEGINDPIKVLTRLTILHAYFIIHQTALVNGASSLLKTFLASKKDIPDYELSDYDLQSALMYLNFQIRTAAFDDKNIYLLEYAFLCSTYDNLDIGDITDDLQKLIDFIKAKTKFAIKKMQEDKDYCRTTERRMDFDLKNSLDFKTNSKLLQGSADELYIRNGLDTLLAGYLFMSYDSYSKVKMNRKFSFKRYFETSKSPKDRDILDQNSIDSFDPLIPLDIMSLSIVDKIDETDIYVRNIANSQIKRHFQNELITVSMIHEVTEENLFANLVNGFATSDIETFLSSRENDDKSSRESRSLLLDRLSKQAINFQLTKSSMLNRFIELAKSYLGYNDDLPGRSTFIVPFNNAVFGLHVQRLIFAFYPAMMSQASYMLASFGDFDKDMSKELVDAVGESYFATKDISQKLDKLYSWLKIFKKREDVIAKLRGHNLKIEFEKFRSMSPQAQGYFVGLNDYSLGNILSLYLEPTFNRLPNQKYDYVQKIIIDNLLSNQVISELSVTNGKGIESNIILWLNARFTNSNHVTLDISI